jgi:hypothetical protein
LQEHLKVSRSLDLLRSRAYYLMIFFLLSFDKQRINFWIGLKQITLTTVIRRFAGWSRGCGRSAGAREY